MSTWAICPHAAKKTLETFKEMLVDISEKEFERLKLKRKDKFKLYFPPDEFHQYSDC